MSMMVRMMVRMMVMIHNALVKICTDLEKIHNCRQEENGMVNVVKMIAFSFLTEDQLIRQEDQLIRQKDLPYYIFSRER